MGLQEVDIFKDMNDSERFASAMIPQKSFKEKLFDLIKRITKDPKVEFFPEEEAALKPINDELL